MRARVVVFALTLASACTVDVSLEGKACASAPPLCLAGYDCIDGQCVRGGPTGGGNTTGGGGGTVPTCHLFDAEPTSRCGTRTERYLAPTGSDTASGLTPAEAWATLNNKSLPGGARVHLEAGDYTTANVLDTVTVTGGGAVCPLEITGPLDGGVAKLKTSTTLHSSNVWVHDLTLAPADTTAAINVPFMSDVRLERLQFRAAYTGGFPRDVESTGTDQLTITGCTFASTGGEALNINFGSATITGNVIVGAGGQLAIPAGAFFAGNDVSGDWNGPTIVFRSNGDGGLTIVRNVFHDLNTSSGPLAVTDDAELVEGNTFFNIAGTAAKTGVFRDNLLVGVTRGSALSAANASADFNLFDTVATPYASGQGANDLMATATFEPGTFVPAANSPAIDRADPNRPVPLGGGLRADIGAFERDAGIDANRRVCLDGGY
ncbi:MAG: right-handed parallel beta-helix repeat-containing protein [Myxococcaceae bacterium]